MKKISTGSSTEIVWHIAGGFPDETSREISDKIFEAIPGGFPEEIPVGIFRGIGRIPGGNSDKSQKK